MCIRDSLNVEFEAFRAYEKAIGGGGGQTTSSGGGQTTSSGGGQTTSSGGGSTTSSGGGQTSGGTALESSTVLPSETNGQAVHNHGISQHARLATTSDGKTVDGYETFIWSGDVYKRQSPFLARTMPGMRNFLEAFPSKEPP